MKKIVCLFIVLILLFIGVPIVAYADAIETVDEFESIDDGDGQYIKEEYRHNYHLDIVKLGITDGAEKMINTIANVGFSLLSQITYGACSLFYSCFSFDITSLFGTEINTIQGNLVSVIFDNLLSLGIFATLSVAAWYLLKRNLEKVFGQIGKGILVIALGAIVSTQSAQFVSAIHNVTKSVSAEMLMISTGSKAEGDTIEEYAANAAGSLWGALVHKPWISLEFGDGYDAEEGQIRDILATSVGSNEREKLIKEMNEDEDLFHKDVGAKRVAMIAWMEIPLLFKCLLYILLAVLQIAIQFYTLFLVFCCPIILIMAMIPKWGGLPALANWFLRILVNQISIIVLSLCIGYFVMIDSLLYDKFQTLGWFIGLLIQLAVSVYIFFKRHEILKLFGFTKVLNNIKESNNQTNENSNESNNQSEETRRRIQRKRKIEEEQESEPDNYWIPEKFEYSDGKNKQTGQSGLIKRRRGKELVREHQDIWNPEVYTYHNDDDLSSEMIENGYTFVGDSESDYGSWEPDPFYEPGDNQRTADEVRAEFAHKEKVSVNKGQQQSNSTPWYRDPSDTVKPYAVSDGERWEPEPYTSGQGENLEYQNTRDIIEPHIKPEGGYWEPEPHKSPDDIKSYLFNKNGNKAPKSSDTDDAEWQADYNSKLEQVKKKKDEQNKQHPEEFIF